MKFITQLVLVSMVLTGQSISAMSAKALAAYREREMARRTEQASAASSSSSSSSSASSQSSEGEARRPKGKRALTRQELTQMEQQEKAAIEALKLAEKAAYEAEDKAREEAKKLEALAAELAQEEWNLERQAAEKLAKQDEELAKQLQKQASIEAKEEELNTLKQQQQIAEKDALLAKQLAEQVEAEAQELKQRIAEDEELARKLAEESGPSGQSSASSSSQAAELQQCGICMEDVEPQNMVNLACQHAYCRGCLTQLVETGLKEKNIEGIKCPTSECNAPMTRADIFDITQNPAKVEEYNAIATETALPKLQGIRQCPTANCPYQFLNEADETQETRCPMCTKRYCANCLKEHSARMSCEQAAADAAMTSDDRERATAEWKKTHTKPCPKCNVSIEKDAGCNHMRCITPSCSHQFCWVCKQPWNADHYRCQ